VLQFYRVRPDADDSRNRIEHLLTAQPVGELGGGSYPARSLCAEIPDQQPERHQSMMRASGERRCTARRLELLQMAAPSRLATTSPFSSGLGPGCLGDQRAAVRP